MADKITESEISTLVDTFYTKVRPRPLVTNPSPSRQASKSRPNLLTSNTLHTFGKRGQGHRAA